MLSGLTYIDADVNDSELLTATAVNSKMIWGYSEEQMSLWQTELEVTSTYILQNKVVKCFDNDNFIGFFAIQIYNEIPEIDHLWLLPGKTNQNYGRKIFQYILEYITSIGFTSIKLVAEPHAKGFYDKMGGKIINKHESKISGRFLDIYEFDIEKATNANTG